MTRRVPYSALKDASDQVRVNAVILDFFERNPEGFIQKFHAQAGKYPSIEAGFQETLDRLRDVLSENISHLPAVTKNKADDCQDLFAQRQLLRAIRDAMIKDEKTGWRPAKDYEKAGAYEKAEADKKAEAYQNITVNGLRGVQADLSEKPLPRPVFSFGVSVATLFSVVQAKSEEVIIPADETAAAQMSTVLCRGPSALSR